MHADAARFDVRELFAEGAVRVLGNLPYYVSSQILFNFTREPSPVVSMIFTLQRELAERLAAGPGTKDYGGPPLLIGRRWIVKYLRTLPASVFTPAPQVESAVVQLTPRPVGEIGDCDGARFDRMVKLGFSQRRKQLRKLLAGEVPDWSSATRALGVPETVRGEELDLAQWVALTNFAAGSATPAAALPGLAQDVHGENLRCRRRAKSGRRPGQPATRSPHAEAAPPRHPHFRLRSRRRALSPAPLPVEKHAPAALEFQCRGDI